jgi:hypothetical protein
MTIKKKTNTTRPQHRLLIEFESFQLLKALASGDDKKKQCRSKNINPIGEHQIE